MPDLSEDSPDLAALTPLLRWAEPLLAPARERALARWADAARRQPERLDMAALRGSIDSAFALPALSWSCRSLLLELALARHARSLPGATPAQRFRAFLDWIDGAAGRAALDARYPLLGPDVSRLVGQTERSLDRLLSRLLEDGADLPALLPGAEATGRLRGIAIGLGDRHDDGDSVVRLDFEAGRVLYKPRSLAMDAAYAQFLHALARAGVEPAQRAAAVLDRGDYGYAQWIAHAPIGAAAQAAAFYRRYGGLAAIAYLLGATDLHYENLIACGDTPVLIDLETLFQPWLSRRGPVSGRHPPYAATALLSGLLPSDRGDPGAQDLSGLAWAGHRRTVRRADGAGTDALRLAQVEETAPHAANLPHLADGTRMAPQAHVEAIVAGFETTYRGLLALKPRLRAQHGPLAPFVRTRPRALLRSTQIYARLLDALSHPQYLRTGEEREAVLARLQAGCREWPFLARTQDAERAALLRGDVPRFWAEADGTDAVDGDGHRVPRLFVRSGWREAGRRARGLSTRDLRRQVYLLRQSLESIRPAAELGDAMPPPSGPAPARRAEETFLGTAVALGDRLLRLAFRDRGEITFFQLEYRGDAQPAVAPMGATLYDGLPGMALLFAELGAQSCMPRFARAAEAALASTRRLLRDDPSALAPVGPFTGSSGWAYVLLALGQRWRRPALVEEALAWLPRIAAGIAGDGEFDLVGGSAGALFVLLELQRRRPSAEVRAAMAACAARLAETAQCDADGASWPGPAALGRRLSGYAHGSAAIGAALARYAQAYGDARALSLARQALRFERAARARRGGHWHDLYGIEDAAGGAQRDTDSWCHGASGVGLARLSWPVPLRDAAWDAELADCMARTLAGADDDAGHCLCHGRWGNLELPLQWAVQRNDAALLARCRQVGHALLRAQEEADWRCGGRSAAETPLGLMIGLAGIAYGCLRLADPWHAPAVLSLGVGTAATDE
ncbi:type 2 lanthipeptide synthetase LanM family protein [Luteimonas aquatica]|uniref:type 2 lanthipeptide synthetase LanM family protein n=1 Tax=Luteimonas aquatica TaxID=450364 RepID=UPI001F563A6F|nr:type 2 lanthipeptide synthetase LanM family protein [Luteimonas aquatica]